MALASLKMQVNSDLHEVDKLIISSLHSEIPLVQQIGHHIVQSGGKRLRPMLVLMCAKACGYSGAEHIRMATVIEFIHTATLLHDDVVDGSMLRRGQDTANNRWGNEAAVLVGDFLYSRAFQLMVQVQDLQILRIVANATNTIAEGEVLQLLHQHNPETTEKNYLHVIRSKTAKLFEAAAEIGAVLSDSAKSIQLGLADFGLHFGTAYQIIDDLLDYQADSAQFGKQLGIDLSEGKPTMPLIYLLKHGNAAQKKIVQDAITKPEQAKLGELQDIIKKSGAMDYTQQFAQREISLAKQAIFDLPDSTHKAALLELADFIIERSY